MPPLQRLKDTTARTENTMLALPRAFVGSMQDVEEQARDPAKLAVRE